MTKRANVKLKNLRIPENKQLRPTGEEIRKLQDIDPPLTRFIQDEADKIRREETRRGLGILKLMELVVSGDIPRPFGEDQTVTIYRLIAHGVHGLNVGENTKRKIKQALAALKRPNRREFKNTDIVAMRRWGE